MPERPIRLSVQVKRAPMPPAAPGAAREIPQQLRDMIWQNGWDKWEFQDRELNFEDFQSYLFLRGMLDALERRIINYCLAGETSAERRARVAAIKDSFRSIEMEPFSNGCGGNADCAIGMQCCSGVCMERCPR